MISQGAWTASGTKGAPARLISRRPRAAAPNFQRAAACPSPRRARAARQRAFALFAAGEGGSSDLFSRTTCRCAGKLDRVSRGGGDAAPDPDCAPYHRGNECKLYVGCGLKFANDLYGAGARRSSHSPPLASSCSRCVWELMTSSGYPRGWVLFNRLHAVVVNFVLIDGLHTEKIG